MTCSSRAGTLAALGLAVWLAAPAARAAVPPGADGGTVIKFATLAPEGTDAMKAMKAVDEETQKATAGRVRFKFYPGGRQGDETDMVRKIRAGNLHGGGFTGVGLGEIAPVVRVLDAPWLIRTTAEADHVYEAFGKEFEKAFEEKGFVLLGWTEVGFVHIFSKAPVRSVEDMRKLKIWMWQGDPIAESAFKAVSVHPVPLSITDVNTSLQTGLIDAVYSAPLYAIALQWTDKMKYIFGVPLANASGAVLVSKGVFDRLSAPDRKALLDSARAHLRTLNELTRRQNQEALKTLAKQGLQLLEPAPGVQASFEEAGRKARRELVGRLYSQDLLERVERSLGEFRSVKGKGDKKTDAKPEKNDAKKGVK
jgi:TRAP-type C4-dicarboxylate transport system substrate-binding protein